MIRPVEEIPMTERDKKETAKSILRRELTEAVENGITKFEIEGDYNYKYLAQYAREMLKYIFRHKVRIFARDWVKTNCPEEHLYVSVDESTFFKVKNMKCEDRNHVYVELFLSDFEKIVTDKCNSELKRHLEYVEKKKQRREEWEKLSKEVSIK